MKMLSENDHQLSFIPNQYLQLYCRECTRRFRKVQGLSEVSRVLHMYTTSGEFISSTVQFSNGNDVDIPLSKQEDILKLSPR